MRLLVVVLLAACGKPAKQAPPAPRDLAIDSLGVTVTAEANWKVEPRQGKDVAVTNGADQFVTLSPLDAPIKTLDDARALVPGGGKLRTERTMANGAFYFEYDVEYPPTRGTTNVVPFVKVILPRPPGAILCEAMWDPEAGPTLVKDVCASLR